MIGTIILIIRMCGVKSHTVDIARDDQRKQLFACPQRLGFENGRYGHLAIPAGEEHQQVHHQLLVNEHVSLGHLSDSCQCVLGE